MLTDDLIIKLIGFVVEHACSSNGAPAGCSDQYPRYGWQRGSRLWVRHALINNRLY